MKHRVLLLPALLIVGAAHSSQSNTDPEIDLHLAQVTDITALARVGTFPNGVNACAIETTACNAGTKPINWQRAMDPDHPFIAFLLARETNGRFEQISDRSYVKHGFFALSGSTCSTCSPTDGTTLGIGCSDTYSTQNNGDNYWLGPPDEIDPWKGLWDPVCSYFDRGDPAQPPPDDCNGARSLTQSQAQALGTIAHRIRVRDSELNVASSLFWFQGMYVIETEGDAMRDDNLGSRRFTPVWSGTSWNLNETGTILYGSILQRWAGASVSSATNGADDGRLYVGVKVTGPVDGFYHFEYAVHNRDNTRGVSALRIPVCPQARMKNAGFADVDTDATNEWAAVQNAGEIVFSTASNPLKWNSIFNFWFDCDAAPLSGSLGLDEAAAGPGLAAVSVTSSAPLGLYNVYLGPGCSNGTPPALFAIGTPPQAILGNASFGLSSTGSLPNQPSYLFFSLVAGTHQVGRCLTYLGPTSDDPDFLGTAFSDANGVAIHSIPIPNRISLEGLDVYCQTSSYNPGNGRLFKDYDLSNGLLVRVGSSLSGCP